MYTAGCAKAQKKASFSVSGSTKVEVFKNILVRIEFTNQGIIIADNLKEKADFVIFFLGLGDFVIFFNVHCYIEKKTIDSVL